MGTTVSPGKELWSENATACFRKIMAVIQVAMIAGLPFTALRDAIFTHPNDGGKARRSLGDHSNAT
jgi:hypothetical protein